MYTKEQLRRLLIPLMFEQVLTALMGSVDTIMVTNRFPCRFIKYFDHQYICRHGNRRRHHLCPILRIQPKRKGQPSLKTIDFFHNPYFYSDYPTLHSIQKTPIKPNLWIRRKKCDGQFFKLSIHHGTILPLHRTIQCRCCKLSNKSKFKTSHGHCVWL